MFFILRIAAVLIMLTFVLGVMLPTALGQRTPEPQRTPDSPVTSWQKLETRMTDNCALCHQRLGEPLAKQVAEWQGSIHAWRGVFCDTCHGGDPTSTILTVAMGEQNGFMDAPLPEAIPEDCGRCHPEALESFWESAHGDLFEANDFEPECVTCHNSHDVREVHIDMVSITAPCGECHDQDYIDEVRNPLIDTDGRIERLYGEILAMPGDNPNAPYLRNRLVRVRKQFRGLAHYLATNTIVTKRQAIDRELDYIEFMLHFDDSTVEGK